MHAYEELSICERYKAGESIPKLSREFKLSRYAVWSTLKRNGVPRRPISETLRMIRGYPLDESYFEKIDTAEKAYWLGFLCADGYLRRDGRWSLRVELELGARDMIHLEKFRRALKTSLPIQHKLKGTCALQIRSKRLHNALVSHGMTSDKSLRSKLFTNLPPMLISHFVRGFFDGDGSISFDRQGKQWRISFCGSYEMIYQLREQLIKATSVKGNKICRQGNIHELFYKGNIQVPKILLWLYKDATVYLDRKYELAMKAINNPRKQSLQK